MSAFVLSRPIAWNPRAVEFVPEAHRKVCEVVSRFIGDNVKELTKFVVAVGEGDCISVANDATNADWVAALREYGDREPVEVPPVSTRDGRMAFENFRLTIEFYIPFATPPPAGYIDMRKVRNRISRLLREYGLCYAGVFGLTSSYDASTNMLTIKGMIPECE